MELVSLKLVTIVSEAVLEKRLLEDLKRLGARGYTLIEVRGEGSRGVRASDWAGRNIRVEAVVSADTARRILDHLRECYFANYAVIAYAADVEVVRGEKYVGP